MNYINQKNTHLLTIIVIGLICIYTAGIFVYIHNSMDDEEKNPIYYVLGAAFSSLGGSILLSIIERTIVPRTISEQMEEIKS